MDVLLFRYQHNLQAGEEHPRRVYIFNMRTERRIHCHRWRQGRQNIVLRRIVEFDWGRSTSKLRKVHCWGMLVALLSFYTKFGSSDRGPLWRNPNVSRGQRFPVADWNHEELHLGGWRWDGIQSSHVRARRRSLGPGCPPYFTAIRNRWTRQVVANVGQP